MNAFVQHSGNDSDKMVLQALVPFTELNEKALFTQKALSNDIDSAYNLNGVEANADYYQRRLDPKRLRDIKRYIYNSILDERENVAVSALFPTSMILAIEQDQLPKIIDGEVTIEIGSNARMYIVDGQHRLMAMRLLYEELNKLLFQGDEEKYIIKYLEQYKFSCTILVNFDIWEQGQVFVNVNFRQKPVNRSLYYDVFGAEYVEGDNPKLLERNKIYLAHELTRFMNESKGSPFYKKIKMLGTGKGYVSQSFFVEALLPLFKPTGVWYVNTMTQTKTESILSLYKSELYNFFKTVSRCFGKYWGENKEGKVHFICKTTGVGAFTRLMAILHRELSENTIDQLAFIEPGGDNAQYAGAIEHYLEPIIEKQDILFGPNSRFSGTGGKGLEMSLFREMRNNLVKSGLIKGSIEVEDFSHNSLFQLRKNMSDRQIEELGKRGIAAVDESILSFMNNSLPSEVDALGNHCRIDEVSDLMVSSLDYISDDEITVKGGFSAKVEVMLDNEDTTYYSYIFPATFTVRYKKTNSWELVEKDSNVYVNTDKYYM